MLSIRSITLCSLFWSVIAYGQDASTDSLKEVINTRISHEMVAINQKRDPLDSLEKAFWRSEETTLVEPGLLLAEKLRASWRTNDALAVLKKIESKALNDSLHAEIISQLGKIHLELFLYREADSLTRLAHQLFLEIDESRSYKELSEISRMKVQLMRFDEAKQLQQEVLRYFMNNGDVEMIATAMYRLGYMHRLTKQLDSSMYYLDRSMELIDEVSDEVKYQIYASRATTLVALDNHRGGIDMATKAFEMALQLQNKKLLARSYERISSFSFLAGDFETAYLSFLKLDSLEDEHFHSQYGQELAEMKIKYEAQSKQRQIDVLNHEAALADRDKIIFLVALCLLVVIILFLLIFLKKRNQLHALKMERMRLKREKLQQEIQFNNNQFTAQSLDLVAKDQLLNELKDDISSLRNGSVLDSEVRRVLGQIIHKVNFGLKLDQSWSEFKMSFEKVHKDFIRGMSLRYQDLSTNELRLCALVRLNLSTKEIAILQNISVQGVKTARYRLRKKLGLKKTDSLLNFLMEMEYDSLHTHNDSMNISI